MSKLEISPEILQALQKVSGLLGAENPLDETLSTVAQLCVATIPGCDSAGVTLRVEGQDMTAAASDSYTLEIDQIQYDSNEGPCLSALEESTFMQIEAVSEETRWPEFCGTAAEHGFRSSISFPLKNDGAAGALNIYSKTERAFEEDAIAVGGLMAGQATVALQNAHTFRASQQLVTELQEALKSRDTIGQAKGILMEREGITDREAFDMLKTISQATNVKLRDVAQRLVDETIHQSGR